jgi:hypothetical protein
VTQQGKRKACLWIRCDREETSSELGSCVLGSEEKGRSGVIVVISCAKGLVEFGLVLEDSRGLKLEGITRIRCNSRICRTCVRIREELLIVINCSVSTFGV